MDVDVHANKVIALIRTDAITPWFWQVSALALTSKYALVCMITYDSFDKSCVHSAHALQTS